MAKSRAPRPTPGRRRGSYSQAARVIHLLDFLRDVHNGVTLAALAERFEVTDRQIRRDLAVIEEAGYELAWTTAEDGKRIRLAQNRQFIRLGKTDRYALLAVRRVFDVLAGTPLHDYIKDVQERLVLSFPDEDRAELEAFGERFLYVPDGGTKPWDGTEEALDGLAEGVLRRRRVRFVYRSAGAKQTSGILEPWALALFRQGLYVIGHATETNGKQHPPLAPGAKPFVYAAERFEEVEVIRGAAFEVPPAFKLDDVLQGAFGLWIGGATKQRVVIDFAAKARPFIEARTWHPSQKLRKLPEGGVRLEMELGDLTLVRPWVLSWGALARVREPPSLVEQVRTDALAMPALYDEA